MKLLDYLIFCRVRLDRSECADEILFKYLGEIENFILKLPKRQTLVSIYFSKTVRRILKFLKI